MLAELEFLVKHSLFPLTVISISSKHGFPQNFLLSLDDDSTQCSDGHLYEGRV